MKRILLAAVIAAGLAEGAPAQTLKYADLSFTSLGISEGSIGVNRSEADLRADIGFGGVFGITGRLAYADYGGPGYEGTYARSFALSPYANVTPALRLGLFYEQNDITLSGGGGVFTYSGLNGQFRRGGLTVEGFWGKGDIATLPFDISLRGVRGAYRFENGLMLGASLGREVMDAGFATAIYTKQALLAGYRFGLGAGGRPVTVTGEIGHIILDGGFGATPFNRAALTISIPLGRNGAPGPNFGARSIQTEIPFL